MYFESDSHVPEDSRPIKLFPNLVRKSTNSCLFGVLEWKKMDVKSVNFVFLKNKLICIRLRRSVSMITNNMLTQKYFC